VPASDNGSRSVTKVVTELEFRGKSSCTDGHNRVTIWVSVAGIPGLKIETWGTHRFFSTLSVLNKRSTENPGSFCLLTPSVLTKPPGENPGSFVLLPTLSVLNKRSTENPGSFCLLTPSVLTKPPGENPGSFVLLPTLSVLNERSSESAVLSLWSRCVGKKRRVPQVSILRPGIPATETQMVTRL
jgi:hypothetical protein